MERTYGSPPPGAEQQYGSVPRVAKPLSTQKRRTNWLAPAVGLIVPWVAFSIIFGLLSFSMHYKHVDLCWFIISMLACVTAICGAMAYKAYKKRQSGDPMREPTWYIFVFITLLLALILGVILGSSNFSGNMKSYYDMTNLNTYPGVDPATTHGQQVMDAGRIMFTRNSYVDVSKSMAFKNNDVYCVAPIVSSNIMLSSYDFWAVGTNCCSGDAPDFHCHEGQASTAHGGLRLMNEGEYYKLAVEQARVAYKINAVHPLFFEWMEDPIAEVNSGQDAGLKFFVVGVLSFFGFQLFVVILASVGFSKLGAE